MAEVLAFIRSLPEIVKVLSEIVSTLKQLRTDSINKELDAIKSEVDSKIKLLILAGNDDERKQALLALATSLGR